MNRIAHTSQAIALLGLLTFAPGCFNDFGEDLGNGVGDTTECLAGSIAGGLSTILETERAGLSDRLDVVGLCNILEPCTADSPLMVGSTFSLLIGDEEANLALGSSDDGVLTTETTGSACNVTQGTITTQAPGTAFLTAADASREIDRFSIEVATATTLELTAPGADDPTAPIFAPAPGDVIIVHASPRDAEDRVLATKGTMEWLLDGKPIVYEDDDEPSGTALLFDAGLEGTHVLTVRTGDLEAELVLTIASP